MANVDQLKEDMAGLEAWFTSLNTCNKELIDQVKDLTEARDIQPQPVNFAALLPNKSTGTDDEDAVQWIQVFQDYSKFQWCPSPRTLEAMSLMISGRARHLLMDKKPATLQAAITLLKEEYGLEAHGNIEETNLMNRQQWEGESMSNYAEDMVFRLNRAGVKDPQRWKYFVNGLHHMLQMYVIDKTFAQVEQFAKKGEAINQINE